MNILLILLSVAMICAGQVLFKLVGLRLASGASAFSPNVLWLMSCAVFIYGAATILWVYVLKFVPLTKAYPFMALCFVVVPLLGVAILSERINSQYAAGVAFIVVGVVMAVRS